MGTVESWLSNVPPELMYVILGIVISLESMGIPLPGEIALVAAALLAVSGHADIAWVAVAASLGAIVGDSIGYAIGHKGGRPFLERVGRRFPRHFGPPHLAAAERTFQRWGVAAIFFGRFIAILRILAGPLAGALRVPYPKFLAANAAGGAIWATGTALLVYYVGKAAEAWLSRFSWIALVVAIVVGALTTLILRRRARRKFEDVMQNRDHSGSNQDGPGQSGSADEAERAAAMPVAGVTRGNRGRANAPDRPPNPPA